MAEKIAQHSIDHFPELYGKVGAVRSAGFAAHNGDPASEYSQAVIFELGYGDLTQHQATKLTQELVDWADVVVSMNYRLSADVAERFDNGHTRFGSMGEFAGFPKTNVPDPFGGTLGEYRRCAKRIEELVILGLAKINNGTLFQSEG
jgi:protein-tyrosine-phosphatase